MWLAAAGAVVIGAAVVVVAALAEADTPRRPAPTRRGTVTPQQLREARIPLAFRGYDTGHVDALLARAARAIEDAHRDGPARAAQGTLPSFLAATFADDDEAAAPRPGPADRPRLGEELEDGGGERPGGLDR